MINKPFFQWMGTLVFATKSAWILTLLLIPGFSYAENEMGCADLAVAGVCGGAPNMDYPLVYNPEKPGSLFPFEEQLLRMQNACSQRGMVMGAQPACGGKGAEAITKSIVRRGVPDGPVLFKFTKITNGCYISAAWYPGAIQKGIPVLNDPSLTFTSVCNYSPFVEGYPVTPALKTSCAGAVCKPTQQTHAAQMARKNLSKAMGRTSGVVGLRLLGVAMIADVALGLSDPTSLGTKDYINNSPPDKKRCFALMVKYDNTFSPTGTGGLNYMDAQDRSELLACQSYYNNEGSFANLVPTGKRRNWKPGEPLFLRSGNCGCSG